MHASYKASLRQDVKTHETNEIKLYTFLTLLLKVSNGAPCSCRFIVAERARHSSGRVLVNFAANVDTANINFPFSPVGVESRYCKQLSEKNFLRDITLAVRDGLAAVMILFGALFLEEG